MRVDVELRIRTPLVQGPASHAMALLLFWLQIPSHSLKIKLGLRENWHLAKL